LVQLLIENGADVTANTLDGYNALHILCRKYEPDNLINIVRIFIDKGVDVNMARIQRDGMHSTSFLASSRMRTTY